MIELKFRTAEGPIVIQFETPLATPAAVRPWTAVVRINGRPSNIYGEDPVEALELATRFVESYLHDTEGLDPPVGPPAPYRAELLAGDERAAAWATANDVYAGYENYRVNCAPRQIRIFRLRPSASDHGIAGSGS